MAYVVALACFAIPTIVQGVAISGGSKRVSLRNGLHKNKAFCPGIESPCNNNGECDDSTGSCWCAIGFGGYDCSEEIQSSYEIKHVTDPSKQDMVGVYDLVPMYLQEAAGDVRDVQFIHYNPLTKGWAISKLNSSCTDDICFYAYGNTSVPPPKGYVYGQPHQHVYYRQLVYDDHDLYPAKLAGYHMIVAYSPDPDAVDTQFTGHPTPSQFTGRYVLQPRYVHRNGNYAIMPVTLHAPGKLWFIVGLFGVGEARRWQIVAQTQDPSLNRYDMPTGGWEPKSLGMTMGSFCQDHITLDACGDVAKNCDNKSPDSEWIRACCRSTCGTCTTPASKCPLPKTSPTYRGAAHMMH